MTAALAVLVLVVAVFEFCVRMDRYETRLDADGARRLRRAPGPSDPGGEREPRGDPGSAPGSASVYDRETEATVA